MRFPELINKGTNLTQWSKDLAAYLRSITPRSSASVIVDRGPGGTKFAAISTPAVAALSSVVLPFACSLVPLTNEDGSPNGNAVRVGTGVLFAGVAPFNVGGVPITGLFNPDPTSDGYPIQYDLDGPDDTSGYTSPGGVPDDYVILEVSGSDPFSLTASIDTRGNGSSVDPTLSPWDPSGNALLACDGSTPPVQTYARIVLASYLNGKLIQNVTSNLMMVYCVVSGQLALYPYRYY